MVELHVFENPAPVLYALHGNHADCHVRHSVLAMSKIFVSYKHSDADVQMLPSGGLLGTTARTYVDALENYFSGNHIYKGERADEDLTGFKDEYIESQLRSQIYDSSLTIVLISKNMFDRTRSEVDQWIPWEISYSLKEITRNGRTSASNAMLAIVLPDRNGSYEYFVESIGCLHCGSLRWKTNELFQILGKNMFNRRAPRISACPMGVCGPLHTGEDHSYIYPVKWSVFAANPETYISHAQAINSNIGEYNLVKQIT